MESSGVFFSPIAMLLAFSWNFATLASVQLTVRLIRVFSVGRTVAASLLLSAATVPLTAGYYTVFDRDLAWMPAMMCVTGAVGFVLARRIMRIRRRRGAVTAAVGIGILSAPWGAFLVR